MGTRVGVESAVRTVERSCAEASDAHDLLERLSHDLHGLVPHDAATWFGADPVTLLVTSPARVEAFHGSHCGPFWHREFFEQDSGLFVDLARGPDPVSALRLSLDDRPVRSARYRGFMQPHGYEDELRGALKVGSSTWGFFGFYRERGRPSFDEHDVDIMMGVSPVIAAALRGYVRSQSPWLGVAQAPGLVMFDRDANVISANAQALVWLQELYSFPPSHGPRELARDLQSLAGQISVDPWHAQVGTPLFALVARARAVADGLDPRPARLRVRDRRGRWLVLHGSQMTGPVHDEDAVAVVIEPAKSAEIAPIIIEAYSLTQRERDVVGAVARGGSTSEIAAELFLSQHTVRDHLKTVFEKVGVSSRTELVAKLFAEHYFESAHADLVDVT